MVKVRFFGAMLLLCVVLLGYRILAPRPLVGQDALVGGISVTITEVDEEGTAKEDFVDLIAGDSRLASVERLLKSAQCRKGLVNSLPGEMTSAGRNYEIRVYGEYGEILEEYRMESSGGLWRLADGKYQLMQMGTLDSRDQTEEFCGKLDQILGYLDTLTLRLGEQTIVPYWCQEWAKEYMSGGWVHGDFVRAKDRLADIAKEVPAVRVGDWGDPDPVMRIQLPENETFSYVHVYDEQYQQVAGWLTEDQFRDFCMKTQLSTCYAAICVSGRRGYVETEGEYNTYGGTYVIRMVR